MIQIYEDTIDDINNYNRIYDYLIRSIKKLGNYESIKNIRNVKMDKLIKEIDEFSKQNSVDKISNIIEKYENRVNELTLIYKNENNSSIRLFGSKFVENNKKHCYLLINNRINELINEIDCKNLKNKIILIKLIEIDNNYYLFRRNNEGITNMSYMLSQCSSLISLPDISKMENK